METSEEALCLCHQYLCMYTTQTQPCDSLGYLQSCVSHHDVMTSLICIHYAFILFKHHRGVCHLVCTCWLALLMSNCTSFENIFRSSIFFYLLSFLQLSLLLYADTLLFITILLFMFILVFWSHLDSFTLSENSSPAFVLLSRHKQLWCFLSKQHRKKRKRGKNRLDLMKHLMKSKSWIQLRFLCCFVFCQIEVFPNVYWKRNDVSQSHSGAQVTDKPWLNQMMALLRWQDSSV